MDHRDNWPDEILEGDLDAQEGMDAPARQSVELIARDGRNMDAVLRAMANRLSERPPAAEWGQAAPLRPRPSWRIRTLVPLTAAAIVASLILMRTDRTGERDEILALPRAPQARSMTAELDVEADRPFAVFPTNDPDIAVVWLFIPKESN